MLPTASLSAVSSTVISGPRTTERVVERSIRGAKVACREWGPPGGKVVFGIHGLTANSLSFADIAKPLAAAGFHVIVPDLRGRNLSPPSGSSTYGWQSYADDVCAIADAVGAKTFSVVGHSMGGYVLFELSRLARERLDKTVLMDALGNVEQGAAQAVAGAIERIAQVFPSADAYIADVKGSGHIVPFTATWERHYREQLQTVPGGVKQRTDKNAVQQDIYYAAMVGTSSYFRRVWSTLPTSTLVVRAKVPLAKTEGNVISGRDAADFKAMRKDIPFRTAAGNHYTIMTEPSTVGLVTAFLKGESV